MASRHACTGPACWRAIQLRSAASPAASLARLSRARLRVRPTGAPHRTSAWRCQSRDRLRHRFLRAPRRRVLISLVHPCSAPQERHSRPSDLSDVTQRAPGTPLCAGLAANTPTSVTEALSRRPGSFQAMEMWKSHKPRFPHFHSHHSIHTEHTRAQSTQRRGNLRGATFCDCQRWPLSHLAATFATHERSHEVHDDTMRTMGA